ncbi:hypothetical protein GGE45_003963 [Rhizobium aethiopicum]|uniref:hypothetical protein n=1 Tax=Rhizobium aethiopicum TaxID=1138170 RepID=UPI0018160780|nr:hypothetical protein [Rhizobium aethiopicum]MBB4581615.1 hypothetical protein [Rhizobium aethiopicum]
MPLAISPPEPGPREVVSQRRFDEVQIEIGLPNGRRLTIPATLDPNILACRFLDAS